VPELPRHGWDGEDELGPRGRGSELARRLGRIAGFGNRMVFGPQLRSNPPFFKNNRIFH
jgi:hypothetical protein